MGQETYDNFIRDGKIDIESGKNTYTLYLDGRVINKTTNKKYCIVPDRPDYPNDDILAIKFAWLKYKISTVEKVAIISPVLGRRLTNSAQERDRTLGYDAFVHYMEMRDGWRRERLTIDEHNTKIVTTRNLEKGYTGGIIDIRCPAGATITMMGISQVPNEINQNTAHYIALRITDEEDREINGHSRIRIDRIKPSEEIVPLVQGTYSQFSLTRQIGTPEHNIRAYKTDNELYRWRMGIMLQSDDMLRISVINSETTILGDNIKINMEMDIWLR